MRTKLLQIEQRVSELETLAREVEQLAKDFYKGDNRAQPELSIKTLSWHMGARGLLEKLNPDRLDWFDHCYDGSSGMHNFARKAVSSVSAPNFHSEYFDFQSCFANARGLVLGSLERLKSLELDLLIQLSTNLSLDEFDTAKQLFDASAGDESVLRAAGTVSRVALERHLFTIAEARGIKIDDTKKKPTAQDAIN